MSDTIQIVSLKKCEHCDGYGGTTREPGPLKFEMDHILEHNTKNDHINLDKFQKQLDRTPKEVPGFTDKKVFIICRFCNGAGQIKTTLSLDDLKNLIK